MFTQKYGESAANVLGQLNEIPTFAYNSANTAESRNMDLWNNAVGRKYGKRTRKRETLAKALRQAMKNGEMILNCKTGVSDNKKVKDFSPEGWKKGKKAR